MDFDVALTRAAFPALRYGVAHFDGPGGTQTPTVVGQAMAQALASAMANRGRTTAAERRADDIVHAARASMADLLGVPANGVVFGRSMTQLTFDFARTLAKQWNLGDEVIVSRLDHDANIRPWVYAAEAAGAVVRWADFDPDTGVLDVSAIGDLLSERTRVVAVTGASNLLGTRPDIPAIADAVHAAGALLYVDGVHLTAHAPVDAAQLGADFYGCSPYKFFGPHMGVLAADPAQLDQLRPDKLLPATDAVPERFELGTLAYELLAGLVATVDFIADLVPVDGDRRHRLLTSMEAVAKHEDELFVRLMDGLAELEHVTVYGKADHRTPTVLFTVAGRDSAQVHADLAAQDINAPAGSFYALEACRRLGLGSAGAVRAGLAPYTDATDVDRLIAALSDMA